jgi:hypothetical protein
MGKNSKSQTPKAKENSRQGKTPKEARLLKYRDWDFFGV